MTHIESPRRPGTRPPQSDSLLGATAPFALGAWVKPSQDQDQADELTDGGSGANANWSHGADVAQRMQDTVLMRGWAMGLGFMRPLALVVPVNGVSVH